MREIKFRAWNQDEQEFQYFVFSQGGHWSHSIKAYSTNAVQEWQQYTGLKDKNSSEIYEGDIVRASLLGDGKRHGYRDEVQFTGNGIIDIDPLHLMVNFKDGNRDNFYIYEAILHRETEVIGNIHETPELLK